MDDTGGGDAQGRVPQTCHGGFVNDSRGGRVAH
jgi:hypothetical protein